jgi:hypothetical protein
MSMLVLIRISNKLAQVFDQVVWPLKEAFKCAKFKK